MSYNVTVALWTPLDQLYSFDHVASTVSSHTDLSAFFKLPRCQTFFKPLAYYFASVIVREEASCLEANTLQCPGYTDVVDSCRTERNS